jgi:SsrA-binding protein
MKNKVNINIENRKAKFNYFIEHELICGIMLLGWEIKAINKGSANLSSAFCDIKSGNLELIGFDLEPTKDFNGNYDNKRIKRLLVTSKDLKDIKKYLQDTGRTLIPLSVYRNSDYLIKVKIGLCKGKKNHDKKESLKQKDIERDIKYL